MNRLITEARMLHGRIYGTYWGPEDRPETRLVSGGPIITSAVQSIGPDAALTASGTLYRVQWATAVPRLPARHEALYRGGEHQVAAHA